MPPKHPNPHLNGTHDTLVSRLAEILIKLNRGESLSPPALAAEFIVGLRTIQRDLVQRFAALDLEKRDGRYKLPSHTLGRLSTADIQTFAELVGIKGLFPSLSHAAVMTLLKKDGPQSLLVRDQPYESLAAQTQDFELLKGAVESHTQVEFIYEALTLGAAPKLLTNVQPYRLVHQRGVWYLAGLHNGKLKTFSLFALQSPRIEDTKFVPNPALQEELDKASSVWQTGQGTQEVRIQVAAAVAAYFVRRELIAGQCIERREPDGSLVLTVQAGHQRQVLPIVQQWLPHLRITQPIEWQAELEATMQAYLQKSSEAPSKATPPVAW